MTAHTYRSRFVLGLAAGVVALAPLAAARAQSLSDGWAPLEQKYRQHRQFISNQLFKGQVTADPNDKMHAEAIDVYAKYNTYRVYLDHLETRDEKQPTRPTMDRVFKDFEGDLKELDRNKAATQPLAQIYRDKIRIHALEVIQHDKAKPIHKLHNARILAKIAELGQGELAETLVTVLKDGTQTDGVRYYALRGLGTLLSQVQPQQMPPLMSKEVETKCAEAIVEFLDRKANLPAKPSQEELDGFRVMRREGIRALAQIHTPSLNEKVRPALVLARFAGADERVQPPPRIDERLEAAIGLANMRSAQSKDYQADYAANAIGQFLGAFATEVNATFEAGKDERSRPWKIDAARMAEALDVLKADSKDAYVGQVVARAMPVLRDVIRGTEKINPDKFNWFVNPENAPPNKEMFKGAADSVVKPAKPAEATEK